MTARAHVERHRMLDRVRVHLADVRHDGTARVARFGEVVFEEHDEPAAAPDDPEPLLLDEDQARALYEALARYFGGAPDMTQVRKDFEHERGRVDRMIDSMIRQVS